MPQDAHSGVGSLGVAGRQEPEGQRRRGSFRGGGKQGRQSTQPRVGSAGVSNLWTLSNSGVSACLVPGPGVT